MLFKYSGKYVKIYFNMKIIFSYAFDYCMPPPRGSKPRGFTFFFFFFFFVDTIT